MANHSNAFSNREALNMQRRAEHFRGAPQTHGGLKAVSTTASTQENDVLLRPVGSATALLRVGQP